MVLGALERPRLTKPYVLAGYALATAVRPLLALATSAWHVIAIRTADRIGRGFARRRATRSWRNAVPSERRGHAFGYNNMMDNVGAAVGPLLAFALVRGWAGRCGRCSRSPSFRDPRGRRRRLRHRRVERGSRFAAEPESSSGPPEAALPPSLRAYLGIVALFTLGASADSFLMLRLADLGLAAGWLPIAWISLNASKAALNISGGKLSDRIGRKRTQIAGWVLYALAYALFPLTRSVALTWVILIVYGAYYGLDRRGRKGAGRGPGTRCGTWTSVRRAPRRHGVRDPSSERALRGSLRAPRGACVLDELGLRCSRPPSDCGWPFPRRLERFLPRERVASPMH